MKFKLYFSITLLLFTYNIVKSQERLSALGYNSELINAKKYQSVKNTRAIALPFVDDFSYDSKLPDATLWVGFNQTFVNRTGPINPPTLGVVTFDGLNAFGMPYDSTNFSTNSKSADTLLSQPIDLSSYTAADSVYFSFFYQPEGNCDQPNTGDSLVLEFKNNFGLWIRKWGIDGLPLQNFKQVLIPITDISYLNSSFQFRMRNKASITGNNDHWHVDYIKIDQSRNINDTLLNDIAIQKPSNGLFKEYFRMPWNQFAASGNTALAATHKSYARNNYNVPKNSNYFYKSKEVFSNTNFITPALASFNFDALANDSSQYNSFDVSTITSLSNGLIKTTYTTRLDGSPDVLSANDSIVEYTDFPKYFCYDDLSAEKAFGVLGNGAKVAIKYTLATDDSVQAIQVHFAHIDADQSNKLFSIIIWKSIFPEQIAYEQVFLKPNYIDSINGFATYILDSGVAVQDSFYVGWQQSQQDILNMGFDVNRDSHDKLFYNLGTTWIPSQLNGSLMYHPFMGKREDVPTKVTYQTIPFNKISVYPNPVTNILYINNATLFTSYNIYNMIGTHFLNGMLTSSINVQSLPAGIYFLKIHNLYNNNEKIFKFIKK
jgi:hypothetical protein